MIGTFRASEVLLWDQPEDFMGSEDIGGKAVCTQ